MPTLKDVNDRKKYYTGELGTVTRQLCYAGIAVLWVLRSEPTKTGVPFGTCLQVALSAFVLSLAFDLLQYAWGSYVWKKLLDEKSKELISPEASTDKIEKTNFLYPDDINDTTWGLFRMKVLFCLIGQVVVISYLAGQLIK